MSKRSLSLLIEDIWESIEKIERYTKGMTRESFQSDEKTTDAVVRNLEIIGEAAGRLPEDFIDRNSEIDWIKIVGLRNRRRGVFRPVKRQGRPGDPSIAGPIGQ